MASDSPSQIRQERGPRCYHWLVHKATARHPSRLAVLPAALFLMIAACATLRPTATREPRRTLPAEWTPVPTTPTASPQASDPPERTATPSPTNRPPTRPPATDLPSEPERGEAYQSPVDGMTLLFVPADDFVMGSLSDFQGAEPDEIPQRAVDMDAFWIDQTEVTWGMYEDCVDAGACPAPPAPRPKGTGSTHPVTGVSWSAADSYCRWVGRRLPTEAEWEMAARGDDGRRYPWGWIGAPESSSGVRLNYCDQNCPYPYADPSIDDGYETTAPVGSYPAGASPFGALDMGGNVWEWTADWYVSNYYRQAPSANPQGPPDGIGRVMRGGSWLESAWQGIVLSSRASNRSWLDPERGRPDLGFRCALSPSAPQAAP